MRARFRVSAALLLTLGLPGWSVPARISAAQNHVVAAEPPRVRLVATGGTISNKSGGRLTGEDLVNLIPHVDRCARPEYEQFSNRATSEPPRDHWFAPS